MSVIEQVQSFVHANFQKKVSPSDSLLDSGLIDSVGIFELVSFLEESVGVKVADEDIVPENFETIASIDALVTRLRGAGTPG